MPEDKLGAWAIGQSVSRDFGAEGLFTGRVTAYRKDGETDLYELEYEDGDLEEVGTEEYKLGLALWIQKWSCEPEKIAEPGDSKPSTNSKATKISKAARVSLYSRVSFRHQRRRWRRGLPNWPA